MTFFEDHRVKQLVLFGGHLLGSLPCSFVLITDKMEDTMDDQKDDHFRMVQAESLHFPEGCLNRNHQIAEEMGMKRGEFTLPHWKCEDVGWFVPTEVSTVQCLNLGIVDQKKAQFSIRMFQLGQYPLGCPSYSS